MITAIAIDDEPNALNVVKAHASRIPFLELNEVFVNPVIALQYLQSNTVDLIFLDIDMPDINGLEFSRSLSRMQPLVIFTTAYSEYALESYEVEAIDYLLKPFEFARFLSAVMKVHERLKEKPVAQSDFFFVNTGFQKKRILYADILYIEADGNYVHYILEKEKVMVRAKIKEVAINLPPRFVQIHKSYIVSLKKIDKIEDNHICLATHKLAIGSAFKENLFKVINTMNI